MDKIIAKAEEGGYSYANDDFNKYKAICNPDLFQALGKACGWGGTGIYRSCLCSKYPNKHDEDCSSQYMFWHKNAIQFHEINLTQSFEKAVEYLSDLIKEK